MGNVEKQLASGEITPLQPVHGSPEHSTMRPSMRPGSFERTFSPTHQKTRQGLANALVLCVDNSEKPPGKSYSSYVCETC